MIDLNGFEKDAATPGALRWKRNRLRAYREFAAGGAGPTVAPHAPRSIVKLIEAKPLDGVLFIHAQDVGTTGVVRH